VAIADSKARTYKVSEYTNKDQQALNQFMQEARTCRQRLRHVDDPEQARRAKICFIRKQQRTTAAYANDPLQLSEAKLLDKRSRLKKTSSSSTTERMTGKDTQNVVYTHVAAANINNSLKC
jgi:hypothetical protein